MTDRTTAPSFFASLDGYELWIGNFDDGTASGWHGDA